MPRDPHRVVKDEFLHELHTTHKGHATGDLDVSDMSAAKMYATARMHKAGVELSVGETADLVGEMAKAIGGDTTLAAQQIVSQMDYERRMRKIGAVQRRNESRARALLMKNNRR